MNHEYLKNQKNFFEETHNLMIPQNHEQHNQDPEYWDILLKDIKTNSDKWNDKNALDFGCGCGRNLINLSKLANWKTIDGCDISLKNAQYSKAWFEKNKKNNISFCETWENSGSDLQPAKSNYYDFVMSHIVFQHISNYEIRFSILKDIFRVLKSEGLASLHFMDLESNGSYYDNCLDFKNCRVDNPEFLINDFEKIGFKKITCDVGNDFFLNTKSFYIKGYK